ncbi:magnesium transporter [Desulfofundulus thermocisternus]|uniref:magnesium transporter n=1 Tax=Desulfofundulus thermocisternus TaxID=42471 RepID=UPI00217D11FF|nr:magnesium transporter [Desulfofundulus thermocisternus]MCS5696180.1 magnesium transporter [Desulfofundulus thermocisternus]
MSRKREEMRRAILSCLEESSTDKLRQCLQDFHPADIAEVLPQASLGQQIRVLRVLDPDRAAQVIFELDHEKLPTLMECLGLQRTVDILNAMFTDDAADLLGNLPGDLRQRLLGLMEAQEARDLKDLLAYGRETAGGIMTMEYVAVQKNITAGQAIEVLREHAPEAETIYYVYVVDNENHLVGVLSLRELILADPGMLIEDIMRRKVISVNVSTDQEEVARLVAKYDLLAVPVVSDGGELLGIVTVDDILDVVEREATEDMMRMAATIDGEGEDPDTSPLKRALRRLPWLVGLLLGELVAGHVIEGFSETLGHITALAFFMTAIAGGTGNAATQSLTVVVRGIATGEVDPGQILKVIWKEAQVGVWVGVVCGLVVGILAFIWQDSTSLGLVVGGALALSIGVSTILGSLVPVIINRLGVDPALASGPFITTLMDVSSMSIYFTLATIILLR